MTAAAAIQSAAKEWANLSAAVLVEHALSKGEGQLAANGALVVETGKRTGRSPLDRFIVKEPTTEQDIDWGKVNRPFDAGKFDALWKRVEAHLMGLEEYYSSQLQVGADPEHALPIVVRTQTAWQLCGS